MLSFSHPSSGHGDALRIQTHGSHVTAAVDATCAFGADDRTRDPDGGTRARSSVDMSWLYVAFDALSIALNVRVAPTAPGWSVVSTIDGQVFSRHATEAQAESAARRLCVRSTPDPGHKQAVRSAQP